MEEGVAMLVGLLEGRQEVVVVEQVEEEKDLTGGEIER